jgi:hypothetical protein
MGLFDSIFDGKASFTTHITRTQRTIFRAYHVGSPTASQNFRASYALCIAGISILNVAKGAESRRYIDPLLRETHDLIKNLQFPAGELTLDKSELQMMLSDFPDQARVNQSTIINGTGGLDAAINTVGQQHMAGVLEKSSGPFGMPAAAGLFVGDFIFGEGRSEDNFMELLQALSAYLSSIV